jgi:hypothetical protein
VGSSDFASASSIVQNVKSTVHEAATGQNGMVRPEFQPGFLYVGACWFGCNASIDLHQVIYAAVKLLPYTVYHIQQY